MLGASRPMARRFLVKPHYRNELPEQRFPEIEPRKSFSKADSCRLCRTLHSPSGWESLCAANLPMPYLRREPAACFHANLALHRGSRSGLLRFEVWQGHLHVTFTFSFASRSSAKLVLPGLLLADLRVFVLAFESRRFARHAHAAALASRIGSPLLGARVR